jgi:hypothetical protein
MEKIMRKPKSFSIGSIVKNIETNRIYVIIDLYSDCIITGDGDTVIITYNCIDLLDKSIIECSRYELDRIGEADSEILSCLQDLAEQY